MTTFTHHPMKENITVLAKGQEYKNYPALCKFLGELVKTGGARINHIQHWKTCFKWRKRGQRFIITEVMCQPTPREHQGRVNSKWHTNVSLGITIGLVQALKYEGINKSSNKYKQLVITSMEMYKLVGLCNHELTKLRDRVEVENISKEDHWHVYSIATGKFYRILTDVLESLHKQHIIAHRKTYLVSTDADNKNELRLATTEEWSKIHLLTGEALNFFKKKNIYQVILAHKEAPFYKYLGKLLEKEGIYNFYNVHEIWFTEDSLQRLEEFANQEQLQESARLDINQKSYDSLMEYDWLGKVEVTEEKARQLLDLSIPL